MTPTPMHRISPTLRRCVASATVLALAGIGGLAHAADAPAPVTPASGSSSASTALADYAKEADVHRQGREVAANYHHEMGQLAMQENRLDDAVRHFTTAVDYQPDNEQYRKDLANVQALSGHSRDARSVYVNQLADQLSVNQQRLWAEAQSRIEEGQKLLAAGDFREAERSFQLAHIRLESLPYADDRKEAEQRRVEGLLTETRTRKAKQELDEASARNAAAIDRQEQIREASLRLERDRISAMYNRALKARERRDYDEAILLCEQILKVNRAEDQSHDLLVKCRRERHVYLRQVTADRWDEEHKLLSEQIRTAMLPQLELLTYSHDWHEIDARRSAPTHGLSDMENDPWRQGINAALDQEITLDFQDTDLIDVISFLQKITNVNFVIDPQVIAGGAVPPVTLRVEGMKLRYVLDYVMRLTQLSYVMRDQAIYVSNATGLRGATYMKLYDVRDLLQGLTMFPGPDLDIPEPGGTGSRLLPPVQDDQPPELDEFVDIIQRVVAPDTWGGDSGAQIGEFQGSMVVTQSAVVHQQVEELLRQLRNQRGTQIHVKVKFLSVENALLEEIGVSWNGYNQNLAPGFPAGVPGIAGSANAAPLTGIGAYNASGNHATGGALNNSLSTLLYPGNRPFGAATGPNDALTVQSQWFHVANGLFASAVLQAVEKESRSNIVWEPDVTLFNGQQAHLVHINQQSYIADYNVVQGQYDPIVSVLSYGTVLDVQAVASADKKYITMTLRPTNAQVDKWRRFGSPLTDFGGETGNVVTDPNATAIAGGNPLLIPQLIYSSVRTSVTIPDGGSLLIGGMTNGRSARSHQGVPFLSHIPFLGRLFSSNGREEQERRLMVMVSGDIILFEEIESRL